MLIEHCVVLTLTAAILSFIAGMLTGGIIEERDELKRKLAELSQEKPKSVE